jgi:hypothetical protein
VGRGAEGEAGGVSRGRSKVQIPGGSAGLKVMWFGLGCFAAAGVFLAGLVTGVLNHTAANPVFALTVVGLICVPFGLSTWRWERKLWRKGGDG